MLRHLSRSLIVPGVMLTAVTVFAQRDRDTYNPNNQAFEVTGLVTIADSKEPARDIPVRLERFSGGIIDQVTTDSRGRFRFANLPRGYYKIIVNVAGYNPTQQDADLTLLFRTYVVFELTKNKGATAGWPGLDVVDARVPPDAREQFVQGRTALAKKSYAEAVTHLEKAVFIYSSFFEAHLLLSTALVDLREWSKAENS